MAWTLQTTTLSLGNAGECDFSVNGNYVAGGGGAGAMRVWSMGDWALVAEKSGYTTCNSVRFTSDNSLLAYTSNLGIHILETTGWTEYVNAQITNLQSVYCQIEFSPDGLYFAYPNGTSDIEVRNVGGDAAWTQAGIADINAPNQIRGMDWHPDGYVLAGDTAGNYWFIETGTWTVLSTGTLPGITGVHQIESHPTKPWFVVGPRSIGDMVDVLEFDAATGTISLLKQFDPANTTSATNAACISERYVYYSRREAGDDVVVQGDGSTWPVEQLIPITSWIYRARFSPNDTWLGLANRSGNQIEVYDTPPAATIAVSGTVTVNGTALSGAKITGLNETGTTTTIQGVTTTAADGTWSINYSSGDVAHILMEYDDGAGTRYNAHSKPFVVVS